MILGCPHNKHVMYLCIYVYATALTCLSTHNLLSGRLCWGTQCTWNIDKPSELMDSKGEKKQKTQPFSLFQISVKDKHKSPCSWFPHTPTKMTDRYVFFRTILFLLYPNWLISFPLLWLHWQQSLFGCIFPCRIRLCDVTSLMLLVET